MPHQTARELALHVARIAWEKDGQDLRVLGFSPKVGICDFCVIATGRSNRQVHAIAEEVARSAKKLGLIHHAVEGDSGWMLVDLGDVILHAFSPEMRVLYDLESLWPHVKILGLDAEQARWAAPAERKH